MQRQQPLDGLQLKDDTIVDQDIDPVTAIEIHTGVTYRKSNLKPKRNLIQRQLASQALFIRRLEQPRSKSPMNRNRTPDDPLRQRITPKPRHALCPPPPL